MSCKADEIPTLAAGRGGTCVTEEYRSFCSVFFFYLLCRYLSIYLSVQERDPKAHRFLGQIYEAQDNVEKACGCYKVSTSLTSLLFCFIPLQMDLIFVLPALMFFFHFPFVQSTNPQVTVWHG